MALAAHALTDYSTMAAELGLSGSTDQALIERHIGVASKLIATCCNRPQLQYAAGYLDKVASFDTPYLRTNLAPLVLVDTISVLNAPWAAGAAYTISSTEYEIWDGDAGIVYRANGWSSTGLLRPDLNFQRMVQPGSEEKTTWVTCAGGWITSPQAYGATATWPGAGVTPALGTLLRANSTDLWQLTTKGALGGSSPSFPVAPALGTTQADGAGVWTYLGTAGAAGARGTAATLPEDLEQACVLTVTASYRARRRDPRIKSEGLLGTSVSYEGTGELPPGAEDIVAQYRRAY